MYSIEADWLALWYREAAHGKSTNGEALHAAWATKALCAGKPAVTFYLGLDVQFLSSCVLVKFRLQKSVRVRLASFGARLGQAPSDLQGLRIATLQFVPRGELRVRRVSHR